MCLAIVKSPGATVDWSDMFAGFVRNDDGCGYAVARDGKIHIQKGLMKWNKFKKAAEHANQKEVSALFHFRLATHGGVIAELCHPFKVEGYGNEEFALVHNGIFSDIKPDARESDTLAFARRYVEFLFRLVPDPLHNDSVTDIIAKMVGYANKVAIMDQNGFTMLFGNWEKASSTDKSSGCHFSNTYWKSHTTYGGAYATGYAPYRSDIPEHIRAKYPNITAGPHTSLTDSRGDNAVNTRLANEAANEKAKGDDDAIISEEDLKAYSAKVKDRIELLEQSKVFGRSCISRSYLSEYEKKVIASELTDFLIHECREIIYDAAYLMAQNSLMPIPAFKRAIAFMQGKPSGSRTRTFLTTGKVEDNKKEDKREDKKEAKKEAKKEENKETQPETTAYGTPPSELQMDMEGNPQWYGID